jgi:putative ABC transport system ATP-binding protein
MLRIASMEITRGERSQAFSVSLPGIDLVRGEVAAITGPSGCGKSTLLEMIGLILKPDRLERYELGADDTIDVAGLVHAGDDTALADLRARRLGFVLQTGGLLPYLTVAGNISLPRRMSGLAPMDDALSRAVERLGLASMLDKLPHQLSIGERQRVAFLRAIAHRPDLLLADEPTAALDPLHARRLFELIIELAAAWQISALVVTHDWSLVSDCGLRQVSAVMDRSAHGARFETA